MTPKIILFCLLIHTPALQRSGNNLPDLDTFLGKVQENLRSDRLLQSRYTFNLKEFKLKPDKDENPTVVETNEFEVYPSLDRKYTYRRHVSKNDQRLSREDIEEQDREYEEMLTELKAKLGKEGIDMETYRLRMEKSERRKEESIIRELPRIYDISINSREKIDGRDAILIGFKPRPDYEPISDETNILSKVSGRAWFCEQDYQLMKLEVEFVDNLTFGWGMLARLHKGTKVLLRRQFVNNEIWMPAEIRISGTARVLLLKKITFNTISQFSNYKKFSVNSSYSFPKRIESTAPGLEKK